MKTKLLFVSTLLSSAVFGQIPNNGFETITSDNHISQWSKSFLISITIDSTGESTGDSIVFDNPDNQLYRSTTDAHSGQYAMEMTNAYNYTSNTGLTGGAFLASSDFYSSLFPELIPVAPIQPTSFSFYYKFLPAGMDSAQATLTVHSYDGFQIGQATITLGGTVNEYTLADIPIVYDQILPVEYISIGFWNASPGNQPTLGTKFIVDDVTLNGSLGIGETALGDVSVYPSPASESFTISGDLKNVTITDLNGSHVSFDMASTGKVECSNWANGCYFIQTINENTISSKKIIIAH